MKCDDMKEGSPSFRNCGGVKNEVLDVIDGDRRLTVREVAQNCEVSKTTVYDILSEDLNMSRVCARWVPRLLTSENLEKRVELSKHFIKGLLRLLQLMKVGSTTMLQKQNNSSANGKICTFLHQKRDCAHL